MGEMTKQEIVDILKRDNPGVRVDDIIMYADTFIDYQEAVDNIQKNGNIVAHPRTGTPIENPYIKVKAISLNTLRKFKRIRNVSGIWE